MIPLQLKFGPEKSRIVLLSLVGLIFVAGYHLSQVAAVGHVLGSLRDGPFTFVDYELQKKIDERLRNV